MSFALRAAVSTASRSMGFTQYISTTALYSEDEGLNWYPIDTVHNRLMDVYTQRTQTSAFVHDNYIWLMGGQTRTEMYSDVMKGKLTSIDW